MKKTLLFLCFATICVALSAQAEFTTGKNQIKISVGLSYLDGLSFLGPKIPSLGLSYERMLNKRLSASISLFSSYKHATDVFYDNHTPGFRNIAVSAVNITGPFVSEADEKEVSGLGIHHLDPTQSIKIFKLPIDVGINYYPINTLRHRLGLGLSFAMTYESHNFFRNLYGGDISFKLDDGTELSEINDNIFFSMETEFRNFSPGAVLKLCYEFHFKGGMFLGTRGSCYNILFTDFIHAFKNDPIWESAIYAGFKF